MRKTNLFEIKRKSGIDDDSDIDVHEDEGGSYDVASAAGLARLAPNGLLKQRESVDIACLKPKLVRMLKQVERHFGKRLVVTSGYRSPAYNRKVRGAEKSQHMYCAAVDVQLPGVSKWELAKFVRAMPGRGGVGTYCHALDPYRRRAGARLELALRPPQGLSRHCEQPLGRKSFGKRAFDGLPPRRQRNYKALRLKARPSSSG